MGPARPSIADQRVLLDAQHRVVLGGEEYHQDRLYGYAPEPGGPPSQVVVELCFAPIAHGEQAGHWGIEARIDGHRVGELIHPVAGWYGPLLDQVMRRGALPMCDAHVVIGGCGMLEVELYLPVIGESVLAGPPPRPAVGHPVPMWMGLLAATLVLLMGASIAIGQWSRPVNRPATPADTTVSMAAQAPLLTSAPVVPVPAEPMPVAAPQPALAAAVAPARSRAGRAAVQPKPAARPKPVVAVAPKPVPTPEKTASRTPDPTPEPTSEPTSKPTSKPTWKPTTKPTSKPTSDPDDDQESTPTSKPEPDSSPEQPDSPSPSDDEPVGSDA